MCVKLLFVRDGMWQSCVCVCDMRTAGGRGGRGVSWVPRLPRVCVCVEHLNRCKTSNLLFSSYLYLYIGFISYTHFHLRPRFHLLGRLVRFRFWGFSSLYIYIYTSIYPMQGSAAWLWDRTQRSYHNHGILGLINPAYLQHHFNFRQWQPAKPRTGTTNFKSTGIFSCTGVAIWHHFQSITMDWAASEPLAALSKDVERIPSLRFLTSILPNMPVSFTGLFLHVRCIPHQ